MRRSKIPFTSSPFFLEHRIYGLEKATPYPEYAEPWVTDVDELLQTRWVSSINSYIQYIIL